VGKTISFLRFSLMFQTCRSSTNFSALRNLRILCLTYLRVYVIPWVGSATEEHSVFNEVRRTDLLGTILHKLHNVTATFTKSITFVFLNNCSMLMMTHPRRSFRQSLSRLQSFGMSRGVFFAHFSVFWKIKSRLMRSRCCLCVYVCVSPLYCC
jgi:hypothetical protein